MRNATDSDSTGAPATDAAASGSAAAGSAPADPTRDERIAAAVASWTEHLAGIGGPDTLLLDYAALDHPGSSRSPALDRPGSSAATGVLDVTHAHPSGLAMLLAGRPTRLSDLVRESGALRSARSRAQAVHSKTLELAQERGIEAGWLAVGQASWSGSASRSASRTAALSAPVLLRRCLLYPRTPAAEDFDIDLSPDTEVNPVLVHHLAQHGVHLDAAALVALAGSARFDPGPVLREVARAGAQLPSFAVEPRLVIGTFASVRLPMLRDLQASPATLADSAVVAALAGDPEAVAELRASAVVPTPRETDPGRERRALNADATQAAAIDAVLAGSHVVLDAPPGTGSTQTVANLIACLAADGRRTLFVASERAAVDGLLQRLCTVGLDHLVLDLHGGTGPARSAPQLAGVLDRMEHADRQRLSQGSDLSDDVGTLLDRRETLRQHSRALHQVRSPWGVTAYEAQSALADLTARRPAPRSRVRVRERSLARLDGSELDQLRRELRTAASLGVLSAGPDDDPWFEARLTTNEEVDEARTVVELSRTALPLARSRMDAVLEAVGMPSRRTASDWGSVLELLAGVRQSLDIFSPRVFDSSLADAVAATASRRWRDEHGVRLGALHRRRLAAEARSMLRPGHPPPDLHEALLAASDQRAAWQAWAGPGSRPLLPAGLRDAERAYADLLELLDWLSQRLGVPLADLELDELTARLEGLAQGAGSLPLVPHRVVLRDRLRAAGLEPLLVDLAQRGVSVAGVGAELELVWWTSLLEHVALTDPAYGGHDGSALRTAALEFADADRRHVLDGARELGHVLAQRLVGAMHDHPAQVAALRSARSVREMSGAAAEVLAAAKPCWALSPLLVPQVLSPDELFDVVVIDGASRLPAAEAVPALRRARQVVLIGDSALGTPTPFLVAADAGSSTRSAPARSLFEELSAALPVTRLRWHHDVSDERLVGFANAHAYDGRLLTVPGVADEEVVRFEPADGIGPVLAGTGDVESPDGEVARVVDLVLEHARRRPTESLAVLTLTSQHACRIDDALRQRLVVAPGIAGFFDEGRAERFVVKAVSGAIGERRDAVIFSVGYGRTPHGRVLHSFGPLGMPGGERLLSATTTRARRRMTVVCSFGADDLDPARLTTPGAQQLRDLLAYAASGGRVLTAGSAAAHHDDPLGRDPLVDDLAARLRAEGLRVQRRHGAGGVPLDLAVGDERLLVAVECDGPAYAAWATVRERDRLRAEQLQQHGWTHVRVWSTDLFRDPAREVARVQAAVRAARTAAGKPAQAPVDLRASTEPLAEARSGAGGSGQP